MITAPAAQIGLVQPAAAQSSASISIDEIPDWEVVAGEEFAVHVSGETDCYTPDGATLKIYEDDGIFGEDLIGSKSLPPTALADSNGDFDTTVSASLDDIGDGGMELEAEVEGMCGSTETARSEQYDKSIVEADSEDPAPDFLGSDDNPESTLSVSGQSYALDSGSLEPVTDFNSEINPGDEVTLTIYTENAGGNAGEFSTVQTQFPNFDAPDDREHIQIEASNNTIQTIRTAGPGDTVYDSDGGTNDARSWQAGIEYDAWGSGAARAFTVTVTPQEAGEFPIYVRSTLTDDMAQAGSENKFTEPVSGVDDPDQDYQMEEITIPVSPVDSDDDGIPDDEDACPTEPEDMDGYEDDDGCPENPAPSVSIDGTQVTEGESTSITADATDPEGESLTYEWNTPQEGTLSGTGSSVTYEAPSGISDDISELVSVTVSEPDANKSAGDSAIVTVRKDSGPALFEVSPVRTTSPVTAGEVLEVTAEIKNTGETTGTQSIQADAGALGSDSTSITLAGGESTTARFSLPTETDAAGDYTLTVRSNDTTAQQNINIRSSQENPSFEIGEVDSDETTAAPGESFSVSAMIENTAASSGTQTIELRGGSNTEPIATQTLQLAGESTTSIRFENISAPESTGSFNYTVATANDSVTGSLNIAVGSEPIGLRVSDIPQTVQPETTFTATYEIENPGGDITSYTLETTAETPNLTVEDFSGDIEVSDPDAKPPGASTSAIAPDDTASVTVEYRIAADATGTAVINATALEPLSGIQTNISREVSISGAPTSPRERALQAAGKSAPSELSQNDVTAIITRFKRGQAANGISIKQNDITAAITLFERN